MGWKQRFGQLAIAKKHDRTPEERALVRRLDIFLMTFGFVSQGLSTVDIQHAVRTRTISNLSRMY
jgi:hypothetical protein